MPNLRVHLLPGLIAADKLAGSTCVVIDVLRATTTTICALAAGARAVIPCLTIDDARQRAAALPPGSGLLGGERGGLPIAGFDLGNSPAEYTPATVAGKSIVLTTTNGTKALLHCRQATDILVGAFVNLSALCSVLSTSSRIDLVCAGTDGEIAREDALLAGAIVARLAEKGARNLFDLNDQAALARDAWLRIMAHAAPLDVKPRLIDALRASQGGRNLIELQMDHDIDLSAEMDRFDLVPHYRATSGSIGV
jgi:2-phosphosulfolactate phosphatase